MSPIDTEIQILANRKSDIDLIKQTTINKNIESPIYILEYESYFHLSFNSDYPEWELDSALLDCFPEYEFTNDLGKGRKEIRLQISRYQSPFSTDGWGRQIEDPLDETKYLVKKSNQKQEKINPCIQVLFGSTERLYYINIIKGIHKSSGNQGYLILDEFKTNKKLEDFDFFKDKLYNTPTEAIEAGRIKMQDAVNQDYIDYLDNIKKQKKEQQKMPRKIIRDFISYCNKNEYSNIFKNLAEDIVFEKKKNWETILRTNNIAEFEKYIKSSNQELCGKDFKIKSNWDFKLPNITITLKYLTLSTKNIEEVKIETQKQIRFVLENNKIKHIVEY